MTNGLFYAIVKKNDERKYGIEIKIGKQKMYRNLSMVFHSIKIDMGITDFTLSSFDSSLVNRYILFLPELDTDGYQKGKDICLYYCIDSEWNELNENMVFSQPKSPGCIYN